MSKKYASGHTSKDLDEEEGKILQKNYHYYIDGATRFSPGRWTLPSTVKRFCDYIYNIEMKEKEVVVNTYPKSGTFWIQYIVWNLVNNPDLDNPRGTLSIDALCPFLEGDLYLTLSCTPALEPEGDIMKTFEMMCPGKDPADGVLAQLAAHSPFPKLVKTHMPLCFLSPTVIEKGKYVYLARDIRDVLASLLHFTKLHIDFAFYGTTDDLIDDFVNDRPIYAPYWQHMLLAWEKRNHPNVCFLFYEDLKADPVGEITKIDKFLGTNRTKQQIQNVVDFTSFSKMQETYRNNEPTSDNNQLFNKEHMAKEGGFFRKGKVGDWKNKFTEEQLEKIHAWMAKNLPQFGEDFKYKI